MINALFEAGTWLSLLILWWMFHWPYRRYQIDKARHELFMMRDRLFDSAAEGSCIKFEDRAYGMTRTMLNGMLRTIENYGFLGMLIVLQRFQQNEQWKTEYANYKEEFEHATSALPLEGQDLVREILGEAHYILIGHMIKTSLLGITLFGVFRLARRILTIDIRKRYEAEINYSSNKVGHLPIGNTPHFQR